MGTDRRDEIAASVAAHQDLGPGYDRAVAEGLVERIGAEIDRRVATGIDQRVAAELEQYLECRHLRRARRRARAVRSGRPSLPLALGSMAVALSATAIVIVNGASGADYANGGSSRSGPGWCRPADRAHLDRRRRHQRGICPQGAVGRKQ